MDWIKLAGIVATVIVFAIFAIGLVSILRSRNGDDDETSR